jgi:hypothetical protein
LALAGLAVVAAMGALTVATGDPLDTNRVSTVVADTTTQGPAATSPAVASAAPPVKATAYVGGDWAGMGKFTGGDWP